MPTTPSSTALLLAVLASPAAAGIDPGGAQAARIDAVFADFAQAGSPGCALGLYERGRLVHARGYGLASIEHGVAIDPLATVFDLGSTSKQFTAASILLLAQDGRLALDDSVRKFLPDLPGYFDGVTLDHLLRHTGGVRDYIALLMLGGTSMEDYTTDEDALRAIARQTRLDFAPGSEHSYSNSGYFLLSQVVEKASGKPLPEFAQERIFAPLDMRDTRILDDHTRVIPHRAASYERNADGTWALSTSAWEQTGDGQVQTTVADLARWDANFHAPVVGGEALVEGLQQVGALDDGEVLEYARGLVVSDYRGLREVSHGGSWAGFRAEMMRFPEAGFTAVALCNTGAAQPTALLHQVVDIVLAERLQPREQPTADTPAPASSATTAPVFEAERYVGTYFGAGGGLLRRIESREGKLWYVRPGGDDSELALEGDHRFRMLDVPTPAALVFTPAPPGERSVVLEIGNERIELREVEAFAPDRGALAGFAGDYESTELDTRWRLVATGDGLVLHPRRGPVVALEPAFTDAFVGSSGVMRFDRDGTGAVQGFGLDVGRARGLAFRRVPAGDPAGASGR